MLVKLLANEIPTQTAFALNDAVGGVYYRKGLYKWSGKNKSDCGASE